MCLFSILAVLKYDAFMDTLVVFYLLAMDCLKHFLLCFLLIWVDFVWNIPDNFCAPFLQKSVCCWWRAITSLAPWIVSTSYYCTAFTAVTVGSRLHILLDTRTHHMHFQVARDKYWTCRVCTLRNNPSRTVCETCESPKENDSAEVSFELRRSCSSLIRSFKLAFRWK